MLFRSGQTVLDRRGIWIPAEATPGDYDLIAGFSNSSGFVTVETLAGSRQDFVTIGHVRVLP